MARLPGSAPEPLSGVLPVAVLIVDDDADLRDTLQDVCEDAGYQVTVASDGVSAVDRLLLSPSPCVVLLDWWLPGMTGAEVIRFLAKDATAAQRHRFILLSAAAEALRLLHPTLPSNVAVRIVEKPFHLDQLLQIVAEEAERLSVAVPVKAPPPHTEEH